MTTVWEEATLTADMVPAESGTGASRGIHAVLPENHSTYLCNLSTPAGYTSSHGLIRAIGAVDCWGVIQIHDDGVVRAEHCRILALSAVVIPERACCACRRLAVVDAPGLSIYKLRIPCLPDRCEGASLRSTLTPVASLDAGRLTEQLLRYYEVAPLPLSEGPWYRPWLGR